MGKDWILLVIDGETEARAVRWPSQEVGHTAGTRNQASLLGLLSLLHPSEGEEPRQPALSPRCLFCIWVLCSLLNIFPVSSFRQWDTLKAQSQSVWGQVLEGLKQIREGA